MSFSESENTPLWNTFLKTVSSYPLNTAVTEDNVSLSYAQLLEAATSTASWLKLGEGRSPFVVLLLPAGIQCMVVSLAALSLGKVVSILHDTHTNTQLEKCLTVLKHPLVVTTDVKWDSLNTVFGRNYSGLNFVPNKFKAATRTVETTTSDSAIDKPQKIEDPPIEGIISEASALKPKNEDADLHGVDYCLFTSGSTGIPKAVLIRGSSVLNAALTFQESQPEAINSNARCLMRMPSSFVSSLIEVWPIVQCGGTLVTPPSENKLEINRYRTWITEQRITVANFQYPVAEMLLSRDVEKLTTLRRVVFAGSRPNPSRLHLKDARFTTYHGYGSTEMFVATRCRIPKSGEIVATNVGKPIKNVKCYVVDDEGNEVTSPDVKGDIYVAGAGLMRGYYGQPELTAKVLVANRFDPDMGKMYATGDCGFWSTDGDLHLTGRKYDLVVIDGEPFELEGIEAALSTFPGMLQTVVVVGESQASKQLVVFCKLENEQKEPTQESLRTFLEKQFLSYLPPCRFIFLDDFPITATGKINRLWLKESELIQRN